MSPGCTGKKPTGILHIIVCLCKNFLTGNNIIPRLVDDLMKSNVNLLKANKLFLRFTVSNPDCDTILN